MWLLLTILIAIYPVTIAIECLIETHRRRSRYRALLKQWSTNPEGEREKLISQWLERNPRCGAGWYLQGVLHLRSGRTRDAARAFGMAHHCDAHLISAALFTFVCLKATDREDSDIQKLVETTWVEMKKPQIGMSLEEKLILDMELESVMEEPPPIRLSRLIYSHTNSGKAGILNRSTTCRALV